MDCDPSECSGDQNWAPEPLTTLQMRWDCHLWPVPLWIFAACRACGIAGGVEAGEGLPPAWAVCSMSWPRPSLRSCTSGSAGSCGATAVVSSWLWLTCGDCATRASGQRPAIPASLTTLRSWPCGGWQTWSSAQVSAGERWESSSGYTHSSEGEAWRGDWENMDRGLG